MNNEQMERNVFAKDQIERTLLRCDSISQLLMNDEPPLLLFNSVRSLERQTQWPIMFRDDDVSVSTCNFVRWFAMPALPMVLVLLV